MISITIPHIRSIRSTGPNDSEIHSGFKYARTDNNMNIISVEAIEPNSAYFLILYTGKKITERQNTKIAHARCLNSKCLASILCIKTIHANEIRNIPRYLKMSSSILNFIFSKKKDYKCHKIKCQNYIEIGV